MSEVIQRPAEGRQPIYFTAVDLRDGEQQRKRYDVMPIEDRIAVFDQIVNAGIGRVEIGHLGNPHDVEFARALVQHIDQQAEAGDERYETVELQALFGSQMDRTSGIEALDGFDKDRVIVHVYDRVSPGLRGLAAKPYSIEESAGRVADAALDFAERGYTKFSISGEGTVDPEIMPRQAADQFYIPVIDRLTEAGSTNININLPNTFGSSPGGEWGEAGMRVFNDRVKDAHPDVTTSIHVHNDHNSATEVAMAAIRAGFDSVEGTMIGMGERSGNVALVDVMTVLLEDGRQQLEVQRRWHVASHAAKTAVMASLWHSRSIDAAMMRHLTHWHQAGTTISAIYDTTNRWERTSLGNPDAYDAGSGPHAHANREYLHDPVRNPLWRNYGRIALVHAMMGRPEAQQIISVNRGRLREISLLTHAAGGSSHQMHGEEVVECSEERRHQAIAMAGAEMDAIVGVVSDHIPQRSLVRAAAHAMA